MSKVSVVIADTDENYLATLEYKFLKELDDKIDLEIISDANYFENYFSTPKTAEIVAVSESLYSRDLLKHNINHLFVLTEDSDYGETQELTISRVYKYTGIKEIYNELVYRSMEKIDADEVLNKETKILVFYSAIGGSGKTSMGLGLTDSLVGNHKKVLYVNTESIQNFTYYLKDKTPLGNEAIREIRRDKEEIYSNIRHLIRNEGFDYLPPFQVTLDAAGLDFSVFQNLILSAKKSKEYDFIVVDVEAGYSLEKTQILSLADKVLITCLQDRMSIFKTEYLLNNLDLRDNEKYMFICNKYDELERNAYLSSDTQAKYSISEYVEKTSGEVSSLDQIAKLNGVQKLAYMFV